MTEKIRAQELKIIEKQIQENLQTVNRALGIETQNHALERSELQRDPGVIVARADSWSDEKRAEEKQYLAARRTELQAIFAENQARFAQAQIMFNRMAVKWSIDRPHRFSDGGDQSCSKATYRKGREKESQRASSYRMNLDSATLVAVNL